MQGQLEHHILQWLQADPYWEKLGQHAQDKSCKDGYVGFRTQMCMADSELEFKHEEGGYVGRSPPGCKLCNNMDMKTPSPSPTCVSLDPLFSPAEQQLAGPVDKIFGTHCASIENTVTLL